MLCDRLMDFPWVDKAADDAAEAECERLRAEYDSQYEGKEISSSDTKTLKAKLSLLDRLIASERSRCKAMDDALAGRAFRLIEGGISFADSNSFRATLTEAQKFELTKEFADSTLQRLATPETAVKSKDWFGLTHDPMWLEWKHSERENDQHGPPTFGALLEPNPLGGVTAHFAITKKGFTHISKCRFFPDTIRIEEDRLTLDYEYITELPERRPGEDPVDKHIMLVADFVIRINSPRITDVRDGEDLSRLNKKRQRNGKRPLFSYRVVDLNAEVKAGLQLANRAEGSQGSHRRLHWRRGHFKCCRTGIFWWNPHLAGKKELGVVEKHYAA